MFLTMELNELSTGVKIVNTVDDLVLYGTNILELACKVLLFNDFESLLEFNRLYNSIAFFGDQRVPIFLRVEFIYSLFYQMTGRPWDSRSSHWFYISYFRDREIRALIITSRLEYLILIFYWSETQLKCFWAPFRNLHSIYEEFLFFGGDGDKLEHNE